MLGEKIMIAALEEMEEECSRLRKLEQEEKNFIKKIKIKNKIKKIETKIESYKETLKYIERGYKNEDNSSY